MAYVFVSSDGEGFQISTSDIDGGADPVVGNMVSFLCDYYLSYHKIRYFDDDDAKEYETSVKNIIYVLSNISNNMRMELLGEIPYNTYVYSARQLMDESHGVLFDVLESAIKVIVDYPSEFADYLSRLIHDPYTSESSYGINVFTYDSRSSSLGSIISTGNEKFDITDDYGNVIKLTPKIIRSEPNKVYTNLNTVDFTFMNHTVKSVTSDIRARIKSLKTNIKSIGEREYSRGYSAGVNALNSLPDGWHVGSIPGKVDKYFIWSGELHPTYINYRSIMYKLPQEISELMFITDIAVPIGEKLSDVLGRGVFPHISGYSEFKSVNHVREHGTWHSTCIGDLSGKPFSQIVDLIPQMDVIYYHSMFGGTKASSICSMLIDNNTKYEVDDEKERVRMVAGESRGSWQSVSDARSRIMYKYAGRLLDSVETVQQVPIWKI